MIALIILSLMTVACEGLIGYDCSTNNLNRTTVSLLEVEECRMNVDSVTTENQYIQLLQLNEFVNIEAIQCKISVLRRVFTCGMFSHISVPEGSIASYDLPVTRDVCRELVDHGRLEYNYQTYTGLYQNGMSSLTVQLAGSLDKEGSCEGAHFSDQYGTWSDAVVDSIFTIKVNSAVMKHDPRSDKVHLPSGTVCTLAEEKCIDEVLGYTYWKAPANSACKYEQYSVLYEGLATRLSTDDSSEKEIVYSFESDDITFALATERNVNLCGYKIIATEHPQLFIYETTRGVSFVKHEKLAITDMNLMTYINSKFIYVERHVKQQITNLYKDILLHRCKVERKTLKNALAIASQSPDQFAFNLMKGPGYMAVIAGEVVHIVQCQPLEVQLNHLPDCYSELPVRHNDTELFLTPKTRILKRYGTVIECNTILPPMYEIDGAWYKLLPKPTEASEPRMLKPMSKPTWKYEKTANLATSGIYTKKDIDQLKNHIMYPLERPALLDEVARKIHQSPTPGRGSLFSKLLDEDSLSKIIENTWSKAYDKFVAFGNASAGIIAIFVIIHMVKTLVNILINGYMLHQTYGWSIRLLGAIWSTLTRFLVHVGQAASDIVSPEPAHTNLNPEMVARRQHNEEAALELVPKPAPNPRKIPEYTQEDVAKLEKKNDKAFFQV